LTISIKWYRIETRCITYDVAVTRYDMTLIANDGERDGERNGILEGASAPPPFAKTSKEKTNDINKFFSLYFCENFL
jgi:hypothetical protein